LPLMEVDSWLTGRRAVALPFTDECVPLCGEAKNFEGLWQSALALGRTRGWKSIELRGGRKWLGGSIPTLAFYGHVLDLTGGEPRMFERLDGSARQAVRKAEKEGVQVAVSTSREALQDFYRLQCQTRQRHGLPPQPWSFFEQIYRHVLSTQQGMVVVASLGDRKVAASVYFTAGTQAIYKYGASDYAWQQVRGSHLVMWAAMKQLAAAGVTRLHLGKTGLAHDGLRRYKLNLGAAEEMIEYVKYDLRREQFVADKDDVEGWHNRVFRKLPQWTSQLAGRLLYKHWA